MDLASILRLLGRRGLLILAFGAAGAIIAAATQLTIGSEGLQPRTGAFRAKQRILLDMPGGDPTQALNLVLLPFSHTEVVKSQAFADEVSRRVGGAYSPQELRERINALPIAATQVLQIEATADSREDASALVQATGAAYMEWLTTQQDNAQVVERNRLSATVLDTSTPEEAEPASVEANGWLVFGLMIGLTIGLIVSFGLPIPDPKPKSARLTPSAPARRRGVVLLPQLTRSSQT